MATTSLIHRALTNSSKIPMYTGKPAELNPWMTALQKKERIYKLTDPELVDLAYDFTDGIASEWIGEYLVNHPDVTSAELFQQLNAQFGEVANSTEAARDLITMKQIQEETLAELANRIIKLAKVAYPDAEHRQSHAVQLQLSKYFIDALNNSFIKEDVLRANPDTLSGALTVARYSERLFQRLNPRQRLSQGTAQRSREEWSSGKSHNGEVYCGPCTMLGESKVEGRHNEWSREEIHPSERFSCRHGKSTNNMNSHYFKRNRDQRTAEGKTRGNSYDTSNSHYSQMTYGEGEKKGHFAKNFPGRERWPDRGLGGDYRLKGKKGWTATGTKRQPNYKNQGNFLGPP